MFEEAEEGDDDSLGTTSMDLGELEEMEEALEQEELEEEEKVNLELGVNLINTKPWRSHAKGRRLDVSNVQGYIS